MGSMDPIYAAMALGVGALIVAAGCAPEKPSDVAATDLQVEMAQGADLDDGEAVVARINGEEITREEFNRRVDGLADFARMRLQSAEHRKEFLERIVEFEMMADEAERRGYGSHARARHAIKDVMVELMIEDHLRQEVTMAAIDDEDRAHYYEAYGQDFFEPERRRLARLVVGDRERVDALVQRWHQKMEGLEGDAAREFREFAFQYSQERSTGDRGGAVEWRTEGDEGDDRFGEDIFEWEPKTLQGPFEDGERWVLKMVIDVEEATRPSAEDLEQEMTARIYEDRRDRGRRDLIEALTADADVKVWRERAEELEAPSRRAAPRLEDIPRRAAPSDDE